MAKKQKKSVRQNFRDAITRESLADLGWAALGSVVYLMVPTALRTDGWLGWTLAVGSAWLTGAAFGLSGMRAAAVGLGTSHLIYVFGQEPIQKATGRPIFRFSQSAPIPIGSGVSGLYDSDPTFIQLPMTREVAVAQVPNDLPSQGMSDYVPAITRGISGYLPAESYSEGVSSYVTADMPGRSALSDNMSAPPLLPHAGYQAATAALPL